VPSAPHVHLRTAFQGESTAAEAIPDGIVALNQNNEIEWCNKPSEKMLGISLSKDINQPINYLLRETSFTEYLNSNTYNDSLKLISWRNTSRSFEILLVPFGASQKLLICRDITQIEKNDSIKRDFIANVSHELKTPLTVIVGFLETLSDMKNEFNEKTYSYLQMMLEQSDRMNKLVEDLLQLSSIESNAAPAEKKEIDMLHLFKNLKKDSDLISGKLHTINMSIKKLMSLLKKKGIETRNFFWPLHQQPILKKMGYFKNSKFKNSEYLSQNGLYLPTGISLNLKQQNYVIKVLKNIFLNK
jgi:two-component system phosphate regulon sensor histidine kinase PhoR